MGTSQRPCFNCGDDILPHQAEHDVPCAYCAAPLHHNCVRPHMLKEHPSRPVPSCGLPPQPWGPRECGPGDREQQRQVNSGCLVGGTYFTYVRRMLQELEAEDGARQSGTVDRLGRHPTFQLEEMERELLAGGGALSRPHETPSLWRAWPVSDRPSPKWIERPEGDEGHGGRTIRGKIRHSEKTGKI